MQGWFQKELELLPCRFSRTAIGQHSPSRGHYIHVWHNRYISLMLDHFGSLSRTYAQIALITCCRTKCIQKEQPLNTSRSPLLSKAQISLYPSHAARRGEHYRLRSTPCPGKFEIPCSSVIQQIEDHICFAMFAGRVPSEGETQRYLPIGIPDL